MCNIVAELDKAGMSDQWIMKNIGMDRDELLRLKQISGLADLFANREFRRDHFAQRAQLLFQQCQCFRHFDQHLSLIHI